MGHSTSATRGKTTYSPSIYIQITSNLTKGAELTSTLNFSKSYRIPRYFLIEGSRTRWLHSTIYTVSFTAQHHDYSHKHSSRQPSYVLRGQRHPRRLG